MAHVRLDGRLLYDWPSFHKESREKFGFPDFYGGNMDAWIDCLSGLRDDDGMSSILLGPDEILHIEVSYSASLHSRAPHILAALEDCIAAVNERYAEDGQSPALQIELR
jgi:RNAse (barnase) inhibitor barstar